ETADEDPTSIIFVGGFLHPPNVVTARWMAEQLMPALRRRRASARLTIIGSHPPESVLALSAPDIRVTGHVLSLAPFLRAAAVVLAPVWNGRGMRHKVLDAMAWGKAIVASP